MNNIQVPITSICLNVTNRCNFNCRYCFVKQGVNDMPFQVADRATQILAQEADGITPSVFFFGGEPTLRWEDLIVPLVEKYPNMNYSITTNGYLLDEEKIDFLAKNNFSIMLSMDGAESTQNYNRKEDSFNKLNNIIPYLLEKIENTNFRGTIIPATCGNTFENILYAQNMGFKSCYFTINIFEKWLPEDKKKLENEIKKYILAYINSFLNDYKVINFTPFTNMVELIIKKEFDLLDNEVNIYKCGLGNGYITIDYKGDYYTCQEIASNYEINQDFHIGNIEKGIDIEAREKLTRLIVNDMPMVNNENNDCQNCPLLFCCKKNTCQVNNYLCNNHCLIQSYNQCWWNLLLYKYAAYVISVLQDLSNFQDYMKEIIERERGI